MHVMGDDNINGVVRLVQVSLAIKTFLFIRARSSDLSEGSR